ncbi:MAG: hypothetical protein ACRD2J_06305, partial [Thermoanaerobaculia bacterium]
MTHPLVRTRTLRRRPVRVRRGTRAAIHYRGVQRERAPEARRSGTAPPLRGGIRVVVSVPVVPALRAVTTGY